MSEESTEPVKDLPMPELYYIIENLVVNPKLSVIILESIEVHARRMVDELNADYVGALIFDRPGGAFIGLRLMKEKIAKGSGKPDLDKIAERIFKEAWDMEPSKEQKSKIKKVLQAEI